MSFGIIKKFSTKPALRAKQYKHFRDVCASQGYVAGVVAAGTCVVYGIGSDGLKRIAADVVIMYTPAGAIAVVGKAMTVGRKVGRLYRFGTMLYNVGMYPLKCANFVAQTPFMALDMIVLGEPYIPKLNAKWWNLGNATDDAETIAEWAKEKSLQ